MQDYPTGSHPLCLRKSIGDKSLTATLYTGKMATFALWCQLLLLSWQQDTGTDRSFV